MRSYSFAWIPHHHTLKVNDATVPGVVSLCRFPPNSIVIIPHTWITVICIPSSIDVNTATLTSLGTSFPRSLLPLGRLCFGRFSREDRPPIIRRWRRFIIVHPWRRWIRNNIIVNIRWWTRRVRFARCRTPTRRLRLRLARIWRPSKRGLHRSWNKVIWYRRAGWLLSWCYRPLVIGSRR